MLCLFVRTTLKTSMINTMMKKILLIVAYSLIVLYVSAQSTLPERYVPYIVDAIYTSDDHVRTSGKENLSLTG